MGRRIRYPKYAKWFNLIAGMIPALVIAFLIGPNTALGSGIGTMFLSFGNAFTFGGLLATLPTEETFRDFQAKVMVIGGKRSEQRLPKTIEKSRR